MSTSSSVRLLSGLTPAQAEAASLEGPVLVLAGAGTGKTRTLTSGVAWRIEARGIPASRILAVTFTNKAAGEMTARIRTMLTGQEVPSWCGTFHGLGARQLRAEPEVAGLRSGFDILDAEDSKRLAKRVLKAMAVDPAELGSDRDPVKLVCRQVGQFKDDLVTPEEAPARVEARIAEARLVRRPVDPDSLRLVARVYAEYQRRLREANAADFGDLLLWPTIAMQRDLAYRQRWVGRFDCVLADEYQDVCHAQYSWLRLLSAGHGEIFVVGDDDQSVYGFRGADIQYIRRFAHDFPRARQVRLEDNFRSTGHILAAANAVIAQDKRRLGKTLRPTRPIGVQIEVVGFPDPEAEARGLVMEMKRRAADGVAWEHMALLYRSNFLSRGFEEALMRGHVPYVIVGDVGFYQRAEIKDALALLRLAACPDDYQSDEAFRRVCNSPPRGLGPKALEVRQAEGFARSVLRLLGLHLSVPDHTTLSRRGRAFAGRQPRAARHDRPVHVVLDSTGLQVFGQGEWNAEKHGRTPRHWRKLHLAVDAETDEILAHVLTDTDVGDITAVPVLLATVEGPIASVIADGAYDGGSVYRAASLRQHDPPPDIVIPPRATSTAATNDAVTHVGVLTARDRHVRDIVQKGRMAWQKKTGYGRRSLVENAIGRYKQTIGPKLRARSCDGQQGEAAIAIQTLNRMIRTAKPVSVQAP